MPLAHYQGYVENVSTGKALAAAVIRVYSYPGNVLQSVFADLSSTPKATVLTDANGAFSFYIADGNYDIEYVFGGAVLTRLINVHIMNPANYPIGANVDTILGAAAATGHFGTFTGTTIADNVTAKPALQALETATELRVVAATLAASGGSALVSFLQTGTGAVSRTVESKLKERVNVRDFGATGLGVVDDFAAINLARASAVATNRELHFPDGTYNHSGTLDYSFANLRVTFGGNVTLKHTGTGKANIFDSGATQGNSVFGIHFGWGNPPTLIGNINTTDLIYVRGSHHMKVDARLRDCLTACRVDFSVLSHFRLNASGNQGAFTILRPTNMLVVDRRATPEATTACKFEVILEGALQYGMLLNVSQHCEYWGTSEANAAGGVTIGTESINNNFYNFFCEQNGTAPHWLINGNSNIFVNCTSGGVSNTGTNTTLVNGIRNLFLRGKYHNITETQFYNEWRQSQLTGTLNMNTSRIQEKCNDAAFAELPDNYPTPTVVAVVPAGLWVPTALAIAPAPGSTRDPHGYVYLVGGLKDGAIGTLMFTLPVGSRPASTIYRTFANPAAGTIGIVSITADGSVSHVNGGNGAVVIDGITFRAVNV